MNKLKTLKDLDEQWYLSYGEMLLPQKFIDGKRSCSIVEDLRQEAIKWIKHYREMNEKNTRIADDDRDVRGVKFGANYQIQVFIKYFFDILEEDLK